VTATRPLFDFTAADDVAHTVWRVADTGALAAAFQQVPLLYVADGHHRAASASRARAALREKNPRHTGDEEYNRVLSVMFPAAQLQILPYNRVVADLAGRSVAEFLAALGAVAPLTPDAEPEPRRRGDVRVGVKEDGRTRWYGFHLEPTPGSGVVGALDVALLEDRVLGPVLKIGDVRTDPRIDFVGGGRGTAELDRRVREGRAAAAFSLFPTSLDELMAVSDEGGIMPPKSTWFEPKLRSGLFVHRI
jgi:uncharacterized protein (DUF1015 family)